MICYHYRNSKDEEYRTADPDYGQYHIQIHHSKVASTKMEYPVLHPILQIVTC